MGKRVFIFASRSPILYTRETSLNVSWLTCHQTSAVLWAASSARFSVWASHTTCMLVLRFWPKLEISGVNTQREIAWSVSEAGNIGEEGPVSRQS